MAILSSQRLGGQHIFNRAFIIRGGALGTQGAFADSVNSRSRAVFTKHSSERSKKCSPEFSIFSSN